MSTLSLILIIAAAVIVLALVSGWIFMYYVSWRVYQGTLEPENAEQLEMWNRGLSWAESVGIDTKGTAGGVLKEYGNISDIVIENDGFRLYGQYIDLGFDRAVIIIPGRCESLMYSYYFAKPYQEAGFNILVIDIRCHGLSTGKYDYVGIGEDSDMIAWAKDTTAKSESAKKPILAAWQSTVPDMRFSNGNPNGNAWSPLSALTKVSGCRISRA